MNWRKRSFWALPISGLLAGLGIATGHGQAVDSPTRFVATEEPSQSGNTSTAPSTDAVHESACSSECAACFETSKRGFLRSDHCFDDFVAPVSNPNYAKDPRSNTQARFLFINNWAPDTHAVTPSDQAQIYAVQVNIALTERLSLIADKDGYATINNGGLGDGFLNLAGGIKYAFIRRPQDQLIVSGGLMYEARTGEAAVLQGYGDGILTPFVTAGKGFGDFHTIANLGYAIPMDNDYNSGFFYWQQHFDYVLTDWFAPILELNWFHYTSGGDHGIPAAVGEGDGLINIGTSGMAGADLVTFALGGRFRWTDWLSTGLVWETPISSRKDFIQNRITLDVILRY